MGKSRGERRSTDAGQKNSDKTTKLISSGGSAKSAMECSQKDSAKVDLPEILEKVRNLEKKISEQERMFEEYVKVSEEDIDNLQQQLLELKSRRTIVLKGKGNLIEDLRNVQSDIKSLLEKDSVKRAELDVNANKSTKVVAHKSNTVEISSAPSNSKVKPEEVHAATDKHENPSNDSHSSLIKKPISKNLVFEAVSRSRKGPKKGPQPELFPVSLKVQRPGRVYNLQKVGKQINQRFGHGTFHHAHYTRSDNITLYVTDKKLTENPREWVLEINTEFSPLDTNKWYRAIIYDVPATFDVNLI